MKYYSNLSDEYYDSINDFLDPEDQVSKKRIHRCMCGTDLPGTCPGPYSCPYSGVEEDEE